VAEETNTTDPAEGNDPVYDEAVAASDAATKQAQSLADEQNEQGYLGTKVDPTPNEDYTVAGVTKDATNS
jgi:hypothetical protein